MKHQSRKHWFTGLAAVLLMSLSLPVSAGSSRAFIPLGTTDSIGVMDLGSHRLTSTISGTVNTHGSALTPDGRFLIVGSLTAHDNQESPVPPEGMTEDEHASHHGAQGDTVLKQPGTGRIYVVDTSTNEIDSVFEVPGPVHHVLITRDGRYAVSTHPMDGGISVVDLDSGEVVEVIATGPSPNYIATTGDGQTLFVSNTGNGTISEVDTRNWFVKRNVLVGGGPEHMALAPGDDLLYINDVSSGEVVALKLSEGAVTARYEVGANPHGLGLSADGQVLFATSQGDERVIRIELNQNDSKSVQLAPAPYHLAVSPVDGSILVTSKGEAKLWVLDPVSLAIVDEVPLEGIGHQISIEVQ